MMLVQLDGGGVEEDVTNKKLTKSKSRRSVDPMMIREEIKNQVVPAIEKIVQAAVAKEVSIALEKVSISLFFSLKRKKSSADLVTNFFLACTPDSTIRA